MLPPPPGVAVLSSQRTSDPIRSLRGAGPCHHPVGGEPPSRAARSGSGSAPTAGCQAMASQGYVLFSGLGLGLLEHRLDVGIQRQVPAVQHTDGEAGFLGHALELRQREVVQMIREADAAPALT